MKDTDWYILYELYRTKNITKAASRLYMTQPTLTKRLQYIEDELQVRIVNRSTKGVQFTREGEFLAEQAAQYVSFWENLKKRMDGFREQGFGTIRIVSSYTYGKYHLPGIIQRFRQEHPNIAFDVQSVKSDQVVQGLEEGRADVAFVRGEYESGLRRSLVLRDQAYLIASQPIRLDQLSEMDRVDSIWGEYTGKLLERWWDENFEERPRVTVTVREADTCWQMARQGLGYTIGFLSPSQIEDLGVCSLPLIYRDGTPVERNTWFLYSDKYSKNAYVENFIKFVEWHYSISE